MRKRPFFGRGLRTQSEQDLNMDALSACIDGAAQDVKLRQVFEPHRELLGSELAHRLGTLGFIECESKLESDVGGHGVLTADSIRAKDGCCETFQPWLRQIVGREDSLDAHRLAGDPGGVGAR